MSDFWRRFRRNRGAVVGLVILALVIAIAAFASLLFPGSPWDMATAPFLPPGEEAGWPVKAAELLLDQRPGRLSLEEDARVAKSDFPIHLSDNF